MPISLIEICPEGHEHPPVDTGTPLEYCFFCGEVYLPNERRRRGW